MASKTKKVNLAAKCRENNMPYHVVHARINQLGWSVQKAVTTPVRKRGTTATSVVKSPALDPLTTAQINEAADALSDATDMLRARDAEIESLQRRVRFWQLISVSVALVAVMVSYA